MKRVSACSRGFLFNLTTAGLRVDAIPPPRKQRTCRRPAVGASPETASGFAVIHSHLPAPPLPHWQRGRDRLTKFVTSRFYAPSDVTVKMVGTTGEPRSPGSSWGAVHEGGHHAERNGL